MYDQFCSFDNLYAAFRAARRGKRSHPAVAAFEFNLETELIELRQQLLDHTYQPGPYHSFWIHDPKRRLMPYPALRAGGTLGVSAAPFRDRVVHHALCQIIEPIFERRFSGDSYANRAGKGTHRALDRCTQFLRRFQYVLPLDVVQFFPSIDHALLRRSLARAIRDAETLALIDVVLQSGAGVLADAYDTVWFPGDDLLAAVRPRGLPTLAPHVTACGSSAGVGNLTSQFWANVYLNELDQFARRRLGVRGYLRYVDDILLFADDAAQLREWHAQAVASLAALRLTVHQVQAQPRPVTEGIPFLGFHVYPDHRRLKRRKVVHAWRHLKALRDQVQVRALPLAAFEAALNSWQAHAAHGDTWRLRRALLRDVVIRYVHA
jgi:hypothetical protein